jgi:hypothetical protein
MSKAEVVREEKLFRPDGEKAIFTRVHCANQSCGWEPMGDMDTGYVDITACDEETAKDLALAINTLIDLNRTTKLIRTK